MDRAQVGRALAAEPHGRLEPARPDETAIATHTSRALRREVVEGDRGRGVRASVEVADRRPFGRGRPRHGGAGERDQLLVLGRQVGHDPEASGGSVPRGRYTGARTFRNDVAPSPAATSAKTAAATSSIGRIPHASARIPAIGAVTTRPPPG